MTIALIAHDSKKELMVQFCTAYCRILSQHKLVATGTTGKMIAEATGLQVQRFLAGRPGRRPADRVPHRLQRGGPAAVLPRPHQCKAQRAQ